MLLADELMVSIEEHYEASVLQERPDEEKAIRALIEIRGGVVFVKAKILAY